MITSVRNPAVVLARSLHRSSVRHRQGLNLLEGPRLIREGAKAGVLQTILLATDAGSAIEATAQAADVEVLRCAPHVISAASDSKTPQGILAISRVPQIIEREGPRLVLVIDGVQDPGNVGSLVRTATAAGATLVVHTTDSADPFGPKALRAGAGAHFHVPIQSATVIDKIGLSDTETSLYASAADGEYVYNTIDWSGPCGLVVGAETHGVSASWHACCQGTVRIPIHQGIESLNVAAASAVILFEVARQRATARRDGS